MPGRRNSRIAPCFALALLLLSTGCDDGKRTPGQLVSQDDTAWAQKRRRWVAAETDTHKWYVRQFLSGTRDIQFFDGWFAVEFDPKTGSAWRWSEKKGIVRLRTRVEGQESFRDMTLTMHGWVGWEHMDVRTSQLEFAVNGHVLGRLDPPHETFQHTLFVPKHLLEHSEWVDFSITIANTAHPRGDWRDVGFCTTGFVWKPADAT